LTLERTLNTLHVVPSLATRTGGPAFNVASLASGLVDAGERATIFATDLGRAASARTHERVAAEDLVPLDGRVRVRIFASRPPRRFAFAPRLKRGLAEFVHEVDLVHVHSLFLYPQAVAARTAASRGVPYIVSPRGSLDPWVRQQGRFQKRAAMILWQTRVLERAAAIHVASAGEASYVSDIAPDVPRLVIPNGVHVEEFSTARPEARERFREQLDISMDDVVVLYVGRISKKKNLESLVDAFALVRSELSNVALVVAGPDDESLAGKLKARVDSHRLGRAVRFLGELRGEAKRAAFASGDIFVMPSHTENFGVAAIEALAAGCAVLLSDGVAIASELQRSGAVQVVRPAASEIAFALRTLVDDAELRRELGAAGRRAAEAYDWKRLIPRYVESYRTILNGIS
jgi:glycosyltransferase involved in cell wall biosynthesis